jgi:hypothetical protein
MSALQNKLFLQNEPNFTKSQINVNPLITSEYEQMDTWSIRKNEPKTNPNEPKTNPILANKTPIRTQTNPIQTQFRTKNAAVFNDKQPAGCRTITSKTFNTLVFSIVFWYSNVYICFFQLHSKQPKQQKGVENDEN